MTTAKDFVLEKFQNEDQPEVTIPIGFEPRDVIGLLKEYSKIRIEEQQLFTQVKNFRNKGRYKSLANVFNAFCDLEKGKVPKRCKNAIYKFFEFNFKMILTE